MDLETFDDVLLSMKKNKDRKFHLLIGNGFSMAYDTAIFSYNALHDFIAKLDDEDLLTILDVIETRNFELIMQHLDNFSALISAFGGDLKLKRRIKTAHAKLKRSLLDAVRALHPEHVFTVPEEQSRACSDFLNVFLNANGNIYSTNYDLLLYWVLMRNSIVQHGDGCGRELENPDEVAQGEDHIWSELMWGMNRETQNVFYLHGALPFFDNGIAITKEEYDSGSGSRPSSYILEKISARMDNGEYPIFVTAGDGQQKLKHIMHNRYLTYCYENFCAAEGSLVTFGFNFGESDEHIIQAINIAARYGKKVPNKLWSVYIGVYSEDDKRHIEKIKKKFKCKVHMYDAKTAHVWG